MTIDLFQRRPDEAIFSEDRRYRYRLTREINPKPGPTLAFIMLNPSIATADQNDPTIRRCIGYATRWQASRLIVCNLFALVSTDPAALYTDPDPIGPENDQHLIALGELATLIVVAYGTHGIHRGRAAAVLKIFDQAGIPLFCLAVTKGGHPGHPLYQRADLNPQPYNRREGIT